MPSPTLPPAFSKGGRRSRLLHMPPTHNPLRLFGCSSRANKPSQNSQQSAAHASPEASTNWERKGLCAVFCFWGCEPKVGSKRCSSGPHALCDTVCACVLLWLVPKHSETAFCLWLVAKHAQAIACAWCAKGQRAAFCLSVPAAAAARLQQPAAQRHNHHHNPASPTSCCVAPPAGRRCQPSLAAESNQSQPVSTWPSCCVLSL